MPSYLQYKSYLRRLLDCWSLIYSWTIAFRRCYNCIFILDLTPGFNGFWSLKYSWTIAFRCWSNYIFLLDLTPGFNGLGIDNCKTSRDTFMFWVLVRLVLDIWRYVSHRYNWVYRLHNNIQYFAALNIIRGYPAQGGSLMRNLARTSYWTNIIAL